MVSIPRSLLALTLAAFAASGAPAQQRLVPPEPVDGVLAEHQARLRTVLKDAYGPDILLRAIVQPSFQLEYAVALRRQGAGFEIVTLQPARHIWAYSAIAILKSGHGGSFRTTGDDFTGELVDTTAESIADLEKDLPANPADLRVSRCAVPVDAAASAALIRAWRRMLLEVRPPKQPQGGTDGTTYSFSMEEGGRTLTGETWSPRRRTRPARFAAIAAAMFAYCRTRQPKDLQQIVADALMLAGRVKPGLSHRQ